MLLEKLCGDSFQDKSLLVSSLLNFFRHMRKELSLIKKFIDQDIEKEGGGGGGGLAGVV